VVTTAHAARVVGVQLEAAPGDLDSRPQLGRGDRGLEPALADVAPRADDIGPDLDREAPGRRGFVAHATDCTSAERGPRARTRSPGPARRTASYSRRSSRRPRD